jgi:hypothetical protein
LRLDFEKDPIHPSPLGPSIVTKELSLLWAWGSELCLAITGLPRVRNCLPERMQAAALRHAEVVEKLRLLP